MNDDSRKIIIFSGTTEGRTLSEALSKKKIAHTVCVATEYGELMQPKDNNTSILEGRKTKEEMRELFRGATIVVDATHPFATEVTENIKGACSGLPVQYLRIVRDEEIIHHDIKTSRYYDDITACVEALNRIPGNVLFTTGSKEIAEVCSKISDISRVYVRVLPSLKSIELCERAGIRNDHIVAMHGPFSEEMNLAVIRQYDIACLVTKDSGKTGGLEEKITACQKAGIPCFCIKRPGDEKGISINEAAIYIQKEISGEIVTEETACSLTVNVIGTGMGALENMTLEAADAVRSSDVVFGAKRLLECVNKREKYPYYLAKDIIKKVEEIFEEGPGDLQVSVLFSGDTGFYSGACKFEKGIKEWGKEHESYKIRINRYPGISSVSYLASKLGETYSDAAIISLHGKNEEADIMNAVDVILHSEKTFSLLSSGNDIAELVEKLNAAEFDGTITVAEKLSYPDEIIAVISADNTDEIRRKGLFTLFVRNNSPQKRLLIPYLNDDEFIRGKTPMTKDFIRHECIRLLELSEGDILFDVGSGTGSIAIEAASLSNTLRIYSFEKKDDAVLLQKENIRAFGQENITLIQGEAPESFPVDIIPDAVFIGGSAGRLEDILGNLKKMGKSIRVVITAISLETMSEIERLSKDSGIRNLQIRQLSESRAETIGNYHLMKAENSVMIAAFDI